MVGLSNYYILIYEQITSYDNTYQLGQLTIQQIQVENKMGDYKVALQNLIEKEQQQAKILSEKYGVGTLDIDSGTFTPQK